MLVERDRDLKHQQASTMLENLNTKVLGMLTLMDADSLACACEKLGSDVSEQKKGNRKLLLKYILRQPNSQDVERSDNGGSS